VLTDFKDIPGFPTPADTTRDALLAISAIVLTAPCLIARCLIDAMHLTSRETDGWLISMAAMVARRRLERGVKLN